MSQDIRISDKDGVVKCVYASPDKLRNYLDRYFAESVMDSLPVKKSFFVIEKLKAKSRGKGVGSRLLASVLAAISFDADTAAVLIADMYEDQNPGFSLVGFYQKFGFRVVGESSNGPVMMRV